MAAAGGPAAPPAPVAAAGSCDDAIPWFLRTSALNAWACTHGGLGINAHWNQQNCAQAGTPGAAHGLGHTVCGACYDQGCNQVGIFDAVVSYSPRGTPSGAAYVRGGNTIIPATNVAWPPLQPPGLPRFDEFWTRLCSACERIEQERFDRNINMFNFGGRTLNARKRAMWNWPWNECECLKLVGWQGQNANPPAAPAGQPAPNTIHGDPRMRLCIQHYANVVQNLQNTKLRNDNWLRTTSRTSDGRLCIASRWTQSRRDSPKSSSHRACRCGADVDVLPHQAEVVMCMACEGMRCLVRIRTAGSKYQTPSRPRRNRPNTSTSARSRGAGDVSLGRARHAFYDNRPL